MLFQFDPIPEEYQKPNISLAAKIAGKNRSVLYRDYIKNGEISVSSDFDGKKFVPLSELNRVFGTEICTQNIKELCNKHNNADTITKKRFATLEEENETPLKLTIESIELKIQNAGLVIENEYLKKMLEDQQKQTKAAELRENRIFEELTRSQLILEDHRIKEQETNQYPKKPYGFFGYIKTLFTK